MNRWFLDENDIDIYLKCTDDVGWHYNKKELVRILNDQEAEIANWRTMYDNVIRTCHNDSKEIKRLNEQISNYKLQNDRVLAKLDLIVRSNQELEKQHDIDNQVIQLMEDNREKDKISFAVEQLEKVKGSVQAFDGIELIGFIDNQIKQLKENKYD